MDTTVSSEKQVVVISDKGPTVLLGERINPSGKKKLAEALKNGDFGYAVKEAVAQVEAGADILVAGTTVFHSPDALKTIHELKTAGL